MITILPNWHPIFVHFSIALFAIAVLFYFIRLILPNGHAWKAQWLTMANWSLWSGCIITLATIAAGIYAYNTVAHDAESHIAMTLHRNWALPTAALFLVLGIWSESLARKNLQPKMLFLSISLIALIMLMNTAWLGAEAVYRYGLGVISLPEAEEHHHVHGSHEMHEHEETPINGLIERDSGHEHTELHQH